MEEPKPVSKSSRAAAAARARRARAAHKTPPEHPIALEKAPRVRAMEMTDYAWYAATNEGLFISVDHGKKWYGQPVEGESDLIAVNSLPDGTVSLVGPKHLFLSHDHGKTWSEGSYPRYAAGNLQT